MYYDTAQFEEKDSILFVKSSAGEWDRGVRWGRPGAESQLVCTGQRDRVRDRRSNNEEHSQRF